jgi:hypothetical protein
MKTIHSIQIAEKLLSFQLEWQFGWWSQHQLNYDPENLSCPLPPQPQPAFWSILQQASLPFIP